LNGAERPPSLGDLVARVAGTLARAGVPDARREARQLVAAVSHRSPGDLLLRADDPADPSLVGSCDALALRRAGGEPLAYLSGWAGFRNLLLQVDRRVLIPRPETEGLVELVLRAVPAGRVADIGTGSGCIALSLAQEGDYGQVVGVERSAAALRVARANADRLRLPVTWLRGDLAGALAPGSCDAVVSNPPYLTQGELDRLDGSVRDWEPHEALVSGADGLEAIRRLVREAHLAVVPGGLLALEVDSSRAADVAALARRSGWTDVAVMEDLFGRDRFVTARREAKS